MDSLESYRRQDHVNIRYKNQFQPFVVVVLETNYSELHMLLANVLI